MRRAHALPRGRVSVAVSVVMLSCVSLCTSFWTDACCVYNRGVSGAYRNAKASHCGVGADFAPRSRGADAKVAPVSESRARFIQ
eukprot:scaffold72611_cov63-Phaeocystis_antarctica.AAC.1